MDISNFGHGFVHQEDARNFVCGAAHASPDWSKPAVENEFNPTLRNQGSSEACVAFTTAEMAECYSQVERSAHYIYCQKFLQGGGMYLNDALGILISQGIEHEQTFPSVPATEPHMEDKTGLTLINTPFSQAYADIPSLDIDTLYSEIAEHGCAQVAVRGDNAGWTTADVLPPQIPGGVWGHDILAVNAFIRNGKKVIKFRNHWGEWGDNGCGYLSEDYFTSGNVQAAKVLTDKYITMLTEQQVAKLYALWGMAGDTTGQAYWVGKPLDDLLAARVADELKALQTL